MQSAAKTGPQALVPLLGLAALLSVLLTAATAQAQPAPQQLFPGSTGVNDRFGHAVAVSGSGDFGASPDPSRGRMGIRPREIGSVWLRHPALWGGSHTQCPVTDILGSWIQTPFNPQYETLQPMRVRR